MSNKSQWNLINLVSSTSNLLFLVVYFQDTIVQRVSDLKLEPLQINPSKISKQSKKIVKPTNGTNINEIKIHQRKHVISPSLIQKTSLELLGNLESTSSFHAPEMLQPLKRNTKSRTEFNFDEPYDLRISPFSPELLSSIPTWKSRIDHHDNKYRSTFKDSFF